MLPRLSPGNRFTVEFCQERARECLALTLESGHQPARHILEHIAQSWSDLAAELARIRSGETPQPDRPPPTADE